MRRIFWILIAMAALFLAGCIDLEKNLGQPCSAERFCTPEMEAVCGADGKTYACAPLAQCENVSIDPAGDACETPASCEPVTCELYCEFGFATDADGCETCACNEPPVECPVLDCEATCIEGYELDENGCETCACKEPPVECPESECLGDCPYGLKTDENGCYICECNDPPEQCEDDPCVAIHCGNSRGQCIRESALATMGACMPVDFEEPAPQCVCAQDRCMARWCTADDECTGPNGLCVITFEDEGGAGYCVNATCDDLREPFQELDPKFSTCEQDSDCRFAHSVSSCCAGNYVNAAGVAHIQQMIEFAIQTSCGKDWMEACAAVDCAAPAPAECRQGVCQPAL